MSDHAQIGISFFITWVMIWVLGFGLECKINAIIKKLEDRKP